jgi:hypothetical protein
MKINIFVDCDFSSIKCEDGCLLKYCLIKAARTSETEINFYQTTWHNNLKTAIFTLSAIRT